MTFLVLLVLSMEIDVVVIAAIRLQKEEEPTVKYMLVHKVSLRVREMFNLITVSNKLVI